MTVYRKILLLPLKAKYNTMSLESRARGNHIVSTPYSSDTPVVTELHKKNFKSFSQERNCVVILGCVILLPNSSPISISLHWVEVEFNSAVLFGLTQLNFIWERTI